MLKKVVEDYIEQLHHSTDSVARVGHKAIVTTGEQSDGKFLQDLIGKSQETGMEIETVIGDTAYSEKDNIRYAKKNELELVSKLNLKITHGTRTKENEFEFNKDAGMYVCKAGHLAIRKSRIGKKNVGQTKVKPIILILINVKFVHFVKGVIRKVQKVRPIL